MIRPVAFPALPGLMTAKEDVFLDHLVATMFRLIGDP